MFLSTVKEGVRLKVRAQPGARRSEIVGPLSDALKIRIAAPPEDGKANAELESFLAKHLTITKNQVQVIAGHASCSKSVLIAGLSEEDVRARLTLKLV